MKRIQGLKEFLGKGMDLFRMETGGISCPSVGQYYIGSHTQLGNSEGWGQGPAVMAVRAFYGWNLAVRSHGGGTWPHGSRSLHLCI